MTKMKTTLNDVKSSEDDVLGAFETIDEDYNFVKPYWIK